MWFSIEPPDSFIMTCYVPIKGTTVSSSCFLSHISEAKSGDLSYRTKPLQRIPPVVCMILDFKKLPGGWRDDSVIKNICCS